MVPHRGDGELPMEPTAGEHVAIVTGVSRGLGAALARDLLERGFSVLGIGRASNPGLAVDRYWFADFDLANAAATDTLLAPVFQDIEARRPDSVCLVNSAATLDPIGVVGHLLIGGDLISDSDKPGRCGSPGQPLLPCLHRRRGVAAGHQHLLRCGRDRATG